MSIVKDREDVLWTEKEVRLNNEWLSTTDNIFDTMFEKSLGIPRLDTYTMLCYDLMKGGQLDFGCPVIHKKDIIDEYEQIDYRASDDDNHKHFANIEQKLESLHVSELRHSQKEKELTLCILHDINASLEHMQQTINFQLQQIKAIDNWNGLINCENAIVSSLIDIICAILTLKTSCFDKDADLKEISIQTFTHKFLGLLFSPSNNMVNARHFKFAKTRKNEALRHCYYSKSSMDKAKYRKAMLNNYCDRCNTLNQVPDITAEVQKLVLKNFQGDLGYIIKEKRKARNLTQLQLSKLSGVERTMIAKVENLQVNTSLETAVKLLTSLDMSISIQPLDSAEFIPEHLHNYSEKDTTKVKIEVIE